MALRHRKYDLLDIIIQGIRDDDWNIIYLTDTKFHPFRLKIYKGDESYNIRIYVWNLTHGGGEMRPADGYRIQITAVVSVKKKIRDNSFKSRILTSYSNHCAFCGIQLKLIDAAHIVPVQHDGTDETSNGIALCALHHRAFDRNLVTFNGDYQIIYNEQQFDKLREIGLDGGSDRFVDDLRAVIHLPPSINDRPHVNYINLANRIRGWD